MARSGKKCLFEDDVRALLGMHPTDEAVSAANTSLEQQFNVNKAKQMTARTDEDSGKEDETSILEPAFSAFGRKLMLLVVVIALVSLIGILIFEEMERSNRKKIHQLPTPIDSPMAAELPLRESAVVTKDNWKALQDKADHARKQRIRSMNPRARAIQARAAREAHAREERVERQLEHEMDVHQSTSTSSGWVKKAGGPHSGANGGNYW